MDIPKDRFYTKTHEWALPEGDTVLVGITDYARTPLATWSTWSYPRWAGWWRRARRWRWWRA